MNIVIPMAGLGRRFQEIGLSLPKPLIKIAGQELLLHSLASLPIRSSDHIIFISLKKDQIKAALSESISARYFRCAITWIEIDNPTEGQLCTVLLAREHIGTEDSLLIHNCDTYFQSGIGQIASQEGISGALSCVQVEGTHWSFAKVNERGFVERTTEKERISDWASVGAYYFANGKEFLRISDQAMKAKMKTQNEYYIAPIYNIMIEQGAKIALDKVTVFRPMGTPEDLERYWGINPKNLLSQNLLNPTLVVDLDGTICRTKLPTETYDQVLPYPRMIAKLQEYKSKGYRIVIHTGRNMNTQRNNLGAVLASVGETTLAWLRRHEVPFDEILFGKPWGKDVIYIDDRSIRPSEFMLRPIGELHALLGEEAKAITQHCENT